MPMDITRDDGEVKDGNGMKGFQENAQHCSKAVDGRMWHRENEQYRCSRGKRLGNRGRKHIA